ncbi:hypothetical protein EPUL_006448 [Erysiphe pulchra]|uniref:Copper transport protein n=1 Tax=Erysiphe pulchra TaxID=225359 RepID=A0A2S4PLD0_9PEZI|nr:hypothetical protein EPUL_006448 [Erysiphe pulchra]
MDMDMDGHSSSMSDMAMGGMAMGDAKPMGPVSSMGGDMSMGNMSMGEMPMSGMSMSSMSMVFFNSMKTTLYTSMWTPNSTSSYAATCFFLIFLASSHRFLFASKSRLEMYWNSNHGSEMDYEEDSITMKKRKMTTPPWRLTVDPLRAILDTMIVAIGFFL